MWLAFVSFFVGTVSFFVGLFMGKRVSNQKFEDAMHRAYSYGIMKTIETYENNSAIKKETIQ